LSLQQIFRFVYRYCCYELVSGFPHGIENIEKVLNFKIAFQDLEKVLNFTKIYIRYWKSVEIL